MFYSCSFSFEFRLYLQKLSELQTRTFQDCSPLLGSRKQYVLSVVRPILCIMRVLIARLIETRDAEVRKPRNFLH